CTHGPKTFCILYRTPHFLRARRWPRVYRRRPSRKRTTYMARKALIVSGAAGPQDVANGVLHRFGFAPGESSLSLADATARLRAESFDLVVVPLHGIGAVDLATLERETRRRG